MKKLFCLLNLLMLSASAYAVQGWMWFNQFPWVYSDEDKNWLYITPEIEVSTYDSSKWKRQASSYISNMGWVWVNKYPFVHSNKEKDWLYITPKNSETHYAFGVWNKQWNQFESYQHDWDKQFEKWNKNPSLYGGLDTLEQLKWMRDYGVVESGFSGEGITDLSPFAGLPQIIHVELSYNNISDVTPLSYLRNLVQLQLSSNNIYDLSPLSKLTNLKVLTLDNNPITSSQKQMLELALPNTSITWPALLLDDDENSSLGSFKRRHFVESASDLEMIWVDPGNFKMNFGSTYNSMVSSSGKTYDVTLSKGFYLGKFEVTQKQAKEVLSHYTWIPGAEGRAVGNVSWILANEFCEKLTELEEASNKLPQGWKYTFPTEAEWEYASRAGVSIEDWWGTNKNRNNQYPEITPPDKYHPQVGLFPPNALGFYDMHGNVSEWCSDWYSDISPADFLQDPLGPSSGVEKIYRGSSTYWESYNAENRSQDLPSRNHDSYGFRVALKQVD
jgi:formylglycine-generating enzyme required for sulfatase activity